MEFKLENSYPGIEKGTCASCGGSQQMLKSETLQKFGCGAVAALDLVRYLHLYHDGCQTDLFAGIPERSAVPSELYHLCIQRLCRAYIPVFPYIATNGAFLSAGMNAYFRHYQIPLQAHWGVSREQLWPEINRMLQQNIPVILGVGKMLRNRKFSRPLQLYCKENGVFKVARKVSGHFMTILGQDSQWLYVSSWGRAYCINRQELELYAHTESIPVLCNILRIFPKF